MWEKMKTFIDELGTKFIKGPFDVDNELYDYKFILPNGIEDYCSKEQIVSWDIEIKENK